MDRLTNTSCTTCQLCQQKYYWRYEKGLVPEGQEDSVALLIGSAFHEGMDADALDEGLAKVEDYFKANSISLLPDAWFREGEMKAKVYAMVRRVWEKWPARNKVKEYIFSIPIKNPETGAKSRTFFQSGKADGVDDDALIDWKTTSNASDFLTQVKLGYQLPGYVKGIAGNFGHKIKRAIYRIIEKPGLRRGAITKTRKEVETEEAYEARCYEWYDKPGKIVEEEIFITEDMIDAFTQSLWNTAQSIMYSRRTGIWMRNSLACNTWNKQCDYVPLCMQLAAGKKLDEVDTMGYEAKELHPELQEKQCAKK